MITFLFYSHTCQMFTGFIRYFPIKSQFNLLPSKLPLYYHISEWTSWTFILWEFLYSFTLRKEYIEQNKIGNQKTLLTLRRCGQNDLFEYDRNSHQTENHCYFCKVQKLYVFIIHSIRKQRHFNTNHGLISFCRPFFIQYAIKIIRKKQISF